jgi:hypothetical protein
LTEQMGDLVLNCVGGPATPANQVVPQVSITVILSVNITSKLTTSLFNEALLIIDEPNQASPGPNSNRPILNCGAAGAPDNSVESGPGVCSIVSDGNPANTYNGIPNKFGVSGGAPNTCNGGTPAGGVPSPGPNGTTTTIVGGLPVTTVNANSAAGSFGCGSPNVFQGRQGNPFNTGAINNISFLGVPFDPPGTGSSRVLRFTNIRGNATQDLIASTFIQVPITEQIAVNGSQSFGINVPTQGQVVAFVQNGLVTTTSGLLDFVQCNPLNVPVNPPSFGLSTTQIELNNSPSVRFKEGFASAWKVRNVSEILANGTFVSGNSYQYNGGTSNPADLNQNVPGVSYNTEAGFQYPVTGSNPTPNPPAGFGSGATGAANGGTPLVDASTNIGVAGIATQGTRLYLSFSSVPQGTNIFVPPVIYLYRQNSSTIPIPTINTANVTTGVAVLTTTDLAGDTAYNPTTASLTSLQAVSNSLAVYEILFEDPNSLEQVDVPVVVSFTPQLSMNAPVGLPATGVTAQVTAGFAPFYQSSSAALPQLTTTALAPSSSAPIPRFIPGTGQNNLFLVVKCACDMLFPFVSSAGGFDTGIAVANTSLDPGASGVVPFVPGAVAQQGTVTFYYFGVGANNGAPPVAQTSGNVPAGQVLTYVLSSGLGGIGTSANGLDNRASGFQGYVIAQAQFQYCHAFAFISALGAGPTNSGISEGYLGLILDLFSLGNRTGQAAEQLLH